MAGSSESGGNGDVVRRHTSRDLLEETIERFLAQDFQLKEIAPEFARLDDIEFKSDFSICVTKYDFTDDELMNRPGIRLNRRSDDEIAKLGRRIIPMVSSGFSEEGAAATLVLAYHLRSPPGTDGDYVFKDGDRFSTMEDAEYTDYSDKVMCIGVLPPARAIIGPICDSVKEEAALYSYIAASMLRLFTKPAATYVKAWKRIIEGFARSYRKPVQAYTRVIPTTPNEESMKPLANWYSNINPKAKVTLFRLLHMSNSNKEHIGMKNFLYDMHLSYTGMHIVSMLFQLCELLKCSPDLVVAAIESGETRRQVKCLKHVLELEADSDGEKHKRKMWRYGRLFDEEFMAGLQTKKCPKLVYTFGEALKSEDPETHAGILNIAQLADVSEDNKKRCAAAAQKLLQILKARPTP